MIVLSPVVVGNALDVPSIIRRVQDDTSFYKAFRNLRILGYTARNDIRMFGKRNKMIASLFSKTQQIRKNNCRSMEVLEENVTGNFYTASGGFNYYTAALYASLFFTNGIICNETNIVGDPSFSLKGRKGMDKHREQLKMLFFNPGARIEGLPLMGRKTAIYDKRLADAYDMRIDHELFKGKDCYVFRQTVKPGQQGRVVVDSMVTWFKDDDFTIVARHYSLRYSAGIYNFDVRMEVEMMQFGELTVPAVIRYNGNWKILGKKRERGIFTATLSNFSKED
jgi:hypothetical protein